MIIETIKGVRVLTPAEGLYLTNGDTYSEKVYLGKNAQIEDWQEVDSIPEPPEPEEELTAEEALAELMEVLA